MSVFDVLSDFILSQLEAVMHVHASVLTTYEPFYSQVTWLHSTTSKNVLSKSPVAAVNSRLLSENDREFLKIQYNNDKNLIVFPFIAE